MSTNISYGSITISDITDVGELSAYPTSNLPLSVIYNQDQNSYTPNWASNNLKVSPTIYYAGTALTPSTTGVTVTWQRQEGISGVTDLTTGETVANGVLTVSQNKFTPNTPMITYILTVIYVEPDSQQTLIAKGQITFNLIKQAATAKTCSITGENIFKYNSNQQIVGTGSIVLTAETTGVEVTGWEYKSSDSPETWTTYPNSTTSPSLTVNATDNVYTSDRVVIRVLTTDANTYDIYTITKLRDGASGTSTTGAVLTNEDQMIACDSSGNPVTGAFDDAVTRLIIYSGSSDDTSNWTINLEGTNVTYQKSVDGQTYVASTATGTNYSYVKVTAISADTGSVTFTCTKGTQTIVKSFSLIKMKVGADGEDAVVYSLECSAIAVNKAADANTFSPSSVTIRAYSKTGNSDKVLYAGRFKVIYGSSTYTSSSNESSYVIDSSKLSGGVTNGYITVELYKTGGTTTKLDTQTIVITVDGEKGDKGDKGDDGDGAVNVILGNQADVIPCSSTNKTTAQIIISIPFECFKGIDRVAGTVATPAKLFGSITASVTQATTQANGSITYTIPSGTSVPSDTGTIALTFTCEGQTIIHDYRWTRSTAATNGTNSVILQLATPLGHVFRNQEGSLTIVGTLVDGADDKTSNVTKWEWAKYSNNTYNVISGMTTRTLTVQGSTVDGYASFRCVATYGGKPYTQYYSLIDASDPIQVSVFSSIGEQIINKQGAGALYVRVMRNETELDELKSDRFLTTNPSSASTGDYYYKIDSVNKKVTLMRFNGTSWASVTDEGYTGAYTWSYRNKDGAPVTTNIPATSGKVIYIDGSFITKKLIADVKVEI